MYCFIRHILASLHFNENVHRECQTSKDGTPYMKVTYPKFKLGDEVVREVQYCAKVMIANFAEFRALFSTKFRRNFVELSLWRHAKFRVG